MGDGCAPFRTSLDLPKSEAGFRLGSIISDAFADHRELAGPGQGDFSPIDVIAYQLTARIRTSCLPNTRELDELVCPSPLDRSNAL
jgi:hypothetical protein